MKPSSTHQLVPSPKSEKPSSSPEEKRPTLQSQKVKPPLAPEPQRKPEKPKQPFLLSLFGEHGVDIPVKVFKPHKVYGYGSVEKKPVDTAEQKTPEVTKKDFDSSRKQHIRDLMSRVKGNNIDTTALFTEPKPQPEIVPIETDTPFATETPIAKAPRESPEPDDTLPLFAGTTYEARADKEAKRASSDWLAKEGFRGAISGDTSSSLPKNVASNVVL